MSAQPSLNVSTRLLIAERSENSAYELDSSLRDAGIGTRLSISDDLAHIAQTIAAGEVDVAIITDKLEGLENVVPRIRQGAPHVPLIMLVSEDNPQGWDAVKALSLGATDFVPANNKEQLALVVQRELNHICEHHQTQELRRALTEAEQRCQLLLQGSQAAIAYIHEGMHIHANEGYLDLFGYPNLDELSTASLVDLLSGECAAELKDHLKKLRNGANEAELEFTSSERSGGFAGRMTLTNSQYEGEDCLQITVREQTQSAAPAAAAPAPSVVATDAQELGLPGFLRAAETMMQHQAETGYVTCVGIDGFEGIQETHGLLGAESVARSVWICLQENVEGSPIAKLSASQFAIAFSVKDHAAMQSIADGLRAKISEIMLEVQDKTVRPTISIAGAIVDEEHGVGACLNNAFVNLSKLAEESNTSQIPSDAPEDDEETQRSKEVLARVNHAIENKMFVLLFQPIISLRGDSDEHYEVFLRMVDEQGEHIEPGEFLQTAIDNNVAGKIDRWVILQSIKMLSVHRAKGHTTRLTINLSANSLVDRDFPQWLSVAIKAARLPSDAVIFQITERDAGGHLRQAREFVESLRNMHCRASLSRFGLSDDPHEMLRHLPVDMVKLDGSCLENIEDKEAKEGLLENVNKLQSQGKLIVVPMVENANILSTLWQAGVNYIQGHYLQEPSLEMDYDFSTEE